MPKSNLRSPAVAEISAFFIKKKSIGSVNESAVCIACLNVVKNRTNVLCINDLA